MALFLSASLRPDNSELLKLMESAAALHFDGQYEESNQAVEKAYALSEKLYTTSVSKNIFALFTDDRALDFEGEDYERIALHDLAMINYAVLGRRDDAVVEAHRLDDLFKILKQKRSEEEVSHLGGFSRYLSGLMYEDAGLWNDALIDYEHAEAAYKHYKKDFGVREPPSLKRDLARLRAKMEGRAASPRFAKGQGEALVLLYENQLPSKQVFMLELRVGPPVPRPHLRIESAWIKAGGKREAVSMELLENVLEKTRFYAKRKADKVSGRGVARGLLKGTLNVLFGVYTYGAARLPSTKEDDRLWRSLPAGVRLARVPLAPGRHALSLDYRTIYGGTVSMPGYVDIKAGQSSMAVFRAFGIMP